MTREKWEGMTDKQKSRWHRRNEFLTSIILAFITAIIVGLILR